MSKLNLEGKVALVTGGARGIGRAIAEAFASNGASVVVTARDACRAKDTALDLMTAYGGHHLGYALNVSDPDMPSLTAKSIFADFKRLDILVNNAGVLGDGLIGMIDPNIFIDTINTNTIGPMRLIQACGRLLTRNGGGSIINISSIIGTRGNRGQMVYAASKSAVIGMTIAAAKELAPQQVRVNAIAPGYIQTDMISHLPPEIHQERLDSIAMGRVGLPSEIADTALYLASDLSRYVTGQIIGVDGGMVI